MGLPQRMLPAIIHSPISWPRPIIVSLGTSLPPLDEAVLTTVDADVPAGGIITTTSASVFQLIPVSTDITDADFAFKLNANLDYGDLPDGYLGISKLSANGARHVLPDVNNLYLGAAAPDSEADFTSSVDASADGVEEDGISFIAPGGWTSGLVSQGNGGILDATVTGSGWLVGWIDFNNDGDFVDAREKVVSQAFNNSTERIYFDIPDNTVDKNAIFVYGRFRLFESEPTMSDFAYTGSTTGGEVEDYYLTVGGVLPIELLSFKAKLIQGNRVLFWKTSYEQNSDYFELERSSDKLTFFPIGQISASNQSQEEKSYSFVDNEPLSQASDILYYRLKSVDLDGSYTYSEIRELHIEAQSNLMIYFVPQYDDQMGFIKIIQSGGTSIPASLKISNSFGQQINQQQINIPRGSMEIPFSFSNWARGLYYATLTTESKQYVIKLFVK